MSSRKLIRLTIKKKISEVSDEFVCFFIKKYADYSIETCLKSLKEKGQVVIYIDEEKAENLKAKAEKYKEFLDVRIENEIPTSFEEEKNEALTIKVYGPISLLIAIIISSIVLFQGHCSRISKPKTQIVVFCADRISYRMGSAGKCSLACSRYACRVETYLRNGWRIVTSAPKEYIVEPFYGFYGCKCIGIEYVLEK